MVCANDKSYQSFLARNSFLNLLNSQTIFRIIPDDIIIEIFKRIGIDINYNITPLTYTIKINMDRFTNPWRHLQGRNSRLDFMGNMHLTNGEKGLSYFADRYARTTLYYLRDLSPHQKGIYFRIMDCGYDGVRALNFLNITPKVFELVSNFSLQNFYELEQGGHFCDPYALRYFLTLFTDPFDSDDESIYYHPYNAQISISENGGINDELEARYDALCESFEESWDSNGWREVICNIADVYKQKMIEHNTNEITFLSTGYSSSEIYGDTGKCNLQPYTQRRGAGRRFHKNVFKRGRELQIQRDITESQFWSKNVEEMRALRLRNGGNFERFLKGIETKRQEFIMSFRRFVKTGIDVRYNINPNHKLLMREIRQFQSNRSCDYPFGASQTRKQKAFFRSIRSVSNTYDIFTNIFDINYYNRLRELYVNAKTKQERYFYLFKMGLNVNRNDTDYYKDDSWDMVIYNNQVREDADEYSFLGNIKDTQIRINPPYKTDRISIELWRNMLVLTRQIDGIERKNKTLDYGDIARDFKLLCD